MDPALLDGLHPSAVAKLADAVLAMRDRIMRTPEGRKLIAQEIERMRLEAHEKGETL